MEKQAPSTKQRILSEALALFSVKGFEPVTVAEIADAVGIKAPSLYKHYKSKQDIFEAILVEMEARYKKQMASMQMDGTDAGKDQALFWHISEEQLLEAGEKLFLYFLHDDYVCKFRKMLMIEQYSNKDLAALYAKCYVDDPLSYQGMLLGMLADAGIFIAENPQIMALHFYAPLFLLLALCDCHPEREKEAIQMMKQHIKQFSRLYRKEL